MSSATVGTAGTKPPSTKRRATSSRKKKGAEKSAKARAAVKARQEAVRQLKGTAEQVVTMNKSDRARLRKVKQGIDNNPEAGTKVLASFFIDFRTLEILRKIARAESTSVSALVREGADLAVEKHVA